MSIGEVLSDARSRSALTIENVSYLTRIRERVIWDIEHDDFRSCGADFYARGHIRAIADVVDVDPAPLIEEYDALHRAQPQATGPMPVARRPPDPTGRDERRRQRSQNRQRSQARPASQDRPRTRDDDRDRRQGRSPVPWIAAICLMVLAIFGWGVYNLVHTPRHSAESAAQAAYTPTAGAHPKSSGHAKPTAPATSPSPTSAQPITIKPVSAEAYGPNGATGDDPQAAREAIDASGTTRWRSDWYSTAAFGNTQSGTGLLLDLGQAATIDSAAITVGTPGSSIQLRGGNDPSHLRLLGHAENAGSTATIRPVETPVRYLLVWFTQLPPDTDGTYRATVYNIALQGTR